MPAYHNHSVEIKGKNIRNLLIGSTNAG